MKNTYATNTGTLPKWNKLDIHSFLRELKETKRIMDENDKKDPYRFDINERFVAQ